MQTAVAMAGELRSLPLVVSNVRSSLLIPLQADLFMDVALSGRFGRVSNRTWTDVLTALRPVHVRVHAGEPKSSSTHYGLLSRWARLLQAIAARERRMKAMYGCERRAKRDSHTMPPLFAYSLDPGL
jgi:hypothetical protein